MDRESLRREMRESIRSDGRESKTPFWMYWQESMGRSETESFRVFLTGDLWSGKIVHLEIMDTEEEGIFFSDDLVVFFFEVV